MKYLPAFFIGFLLAALLFYAFQSAPDYTLLLDYLATVPNLNANSKEWLLLLFHDSLISIISAAAIVFGYRKLMPVQPFDWLAIALMQLPVTVLITMVNGVPARFSTTYEVATSVASIFALSCVLLVYAAIIAYNKALKADSQ
ncbi:hypothetical protein [Pseudoalteromonas sp. T1lg75]|uniref:hypothetical protein n=1 Tax=Pseudoalteromonas sp. T1lg75 TaxID=2077102 RepID=UPI000CF65F7C|nr:hypothetical protein [Pseudoalteromonas sp. T1lg75]